MGCGASADPSSRRSARQSIARLTRAGTTWFRRDVHGAELDAELQKHFEDIADTPLNCAIDEGGESAFGEKLTLQLASQLQESMVRRFSSGTARTSSGSVRTKKKSVDMLSGVQSSLGDYDKHASHMLEYMPSILVGSAADKFLLEQEHVWVSPAHPLPRGAIDIHLIDVASVVNRYFDDTQCYIPPSCCQAFNEKWRAMFIELFADFPEELLEVQKTGCSNGWPLRIQLMRLPPNTWFRVHAHPNIEYEHTLAGTLHEIRLSNALVPKDFGVEPGTASGPWGPDLQQLAVEAGEPLEWDMECVPKGYFLSNAIGSVHQSFTKDEGATLLLLWSGCHANICPHNCMGVHKRLQPEAGWPEGYTCSHTQERTLSLRSVETIEAEPSTTDIQPATICSSSSMAKKASDKYLATLH